MDGKKEPGDSWLVTITGLGMLVMVVGGFVFAITGFIGSLIGWWIPDIVATVFGLIFIVGVTAWELLFVIRGFFAPPEFRCFGIMMAPIGTLALLIYPSWFGDLFQGLYSSYGGFAGVAQNADAAWSTFAYSWFLDSVTFNASQIWDWLPTPIRPTAWWSDLLLWVFCLVSDFILYAGLVNMLRLLWFGVTGRGGIKEQKE
jgi:hypothetical protein